MANSNKSAAKPKSMGISRRARLVVGIVILAVLGGWVFYKKFSQSQTARAEDEMEALIAAVKRDYGRLSDKQNAYLDQMLKSDDGTKRARAHFLRGEFTEGESELRKAGGNPDRAAVETALGDRFYIAKDYDKAELHYELANDDDDSSQAKESLAMALTKSQQHSFGENFDKSIALLTEVLESQAKQSERWARLQYELGITWQERTLGNREQNSEKAIRCLNDALRVWTKEKYPEDWAAVQVALGNVWQQKSTGNFKENLEQSLACYAAAMTIFTESGYPKDWAWAMNNLGNSLTGSQSGDHTASIERAIACFNDALKVRTREQYPMAWAYTQNNLGIAWLDRSTGDRRENCAKARMCFENAMQVFTHAERPVDWAMAQENLGVARKDDPSSPSADKVNRALECFERALSVIKQEADPGHWAKVQANMGRAYLDYPDEANMSNGDICFTNALKVYSKDEYPVEWAEIQADLAMAWLQRPVASEQDVNIAVGKAIGLSEAALTVLTREGAPNTWAFAKHCLGTAHLSSREKRSESLASAIANFGDALTVRTREANPIEWATTRHNLAGAYEAVAEMAKWHDKEMLVKAIESDKGALTVLTKETDEIMNVVITERLNRLRSAFTNAGYEGFDEIQPAK